MKSSGGAQRHSYDISALDASSEVLRLEQQVDLVRQIERPYLERLGLAPDATCLDLGCGPGFLSRVLAELVPAGRVIGVDADRGLLAQARAGFALRGLANGRFVRGWADHLPLRSGVADLVYARFLLQHVRRPVAVLTEARRVGKPGGWVAAVDTDDGALMVHPDSGRLGRLLAASGEAQARLGGDRHIGRKLRQHMIDAGFSDVRVEVVPFTSEMVGMSNFLAITLGFKRQIIDADLMSAAEVEAALDELQALDPARGAFAHTLGYAAWGRVPGG